MCTDSYPQEQWVNLRTYVRLGLYAQFFIMYVHTGSDSQNQYVHRQSMMLCTYPRTYACTHMCYEGRGLSGVISDIIKPLTVCQRGSFRSDYIFAGIAVVRTFGEERRSRVKYGSPAKNFKKCFIVIFHIFFFNF